MDGGLDIKTGKFKERHHYYGTADDVVASRGFDAGVGDIDGEIPSGDLAFDLAQATFHTGIDLCFAHTTEEIPFITLGAARWFNERRMVHVCTEHPSGLALGLTVLVGDQQIPELVTAQLHIRAILE